MKIGLKKRIGMFLILCSLLLFVATPLKSVTGATIDISDLTVKIWFFIGLSMLVFGGILIYPHYKLKPLEELTNSEGGSEDKVYVLDSSGAIDYKSQIGNFIKGHDGQIYVPKRIRQELHRNPLLRDTIDRPNVKSIDSKHLYGDHFSEEDRAKYKARRRKAIQLLGESPKHQAYLHLKPLLTKSHITPEDLSHLSYSDKRVLDTIDNRLREKHKPITQQNRLDLLRTYKVSKGDADVLTNTLELIEEGHKDAEVLAEDSHLTYAIDRLRKENPEFRKHLHLLKYRDYSGQYSKAA